MHKRESLKCIELLCDRLHFIRSVHKLNLSFFSGLQNRPTANHIITYEPVVSCYEYLSRLKTKYDVIITNDSLYFNV